MRTWPAFVLLIAACGGSAAPVTDASTSLPPSTSTPTTLSTTPVPTEAPRESHPLRLTDADIAIPVTAEPFEFTPGFLALVEGTVLNGIAEVEMADGGLGARPFLFRVEEGAATVLRGRYCGTWWGPPPLDDGAGGAIIEGEQPAAYRCSPGLEQSYGSASPRAIGRLDGRLVLAALSWEGDPTLVFYDVEDGTEVPFFAIGAEGLDSVSAGGSRWLLGLVGDDGRVGYVVLDESGEPDPTATPPPDGEVAVTALSADGRFAFVGTTTPASFEFSVWDLDAGTESAGFSIDRPSADLFLYGLDIDPPRAIVDIGAIDGESHPFAVLLVDLDGGDVVLVDPGFDILAVAPLPVTSVVDPGVPGLEVNLISFLDG